LARPREFDEAEVLQAATQQFWLHGYAATSVRDLTEQMGITGASLYNAFKTSRLCTGAHLSTIWISPCANALPGSNAACLLAEAIAGFLNEVIERSLNDKQSRGCMLVNSTLELAPHDPELRHLVRQELQQIQQFFRRCVLKGQQTG
jgi:TetR/AcrR family transcriptional repressor of nem operon